MFQFFKKALSKIYTTISSRLESLFAQSTIDDATLEELEKILLSADTGVSLTRSIIDTLKKQQARGTIKQGTDLKEALHDLLLSHLHTFTPDAQVYLLVGINGSGKTTFAAKLASWFTLQNKKVLLVGADTFRAAATEQLSSWANRLNLSLITGKPHQDPASVVYQGCQAFKEKDYDILIIDTAGRLQTKTPLMKELEKIRSTITKQLGERNIATLLTIDAMLGQNSFDQAQIFHESTHVDGIVLTKMDGTGKGGIVFAIEKAFAIPVAFISFGEQPDELALFDPQAYVTSLLQSTN